MSDEEFTNFGGEVVKIIRKMTPHDTNNLRDNATVYESIGSDTIRIRVKQEVAPYVIYVNGYEKLYERPNKNHQYWNRAVKLALETAAKKYGGTASIV